MLHYAQIAHSRLSLAFSLLIGRLSEFFTSPRSPRSRRRRMNAFPALALAALLLITLASLLPSVPAFHADLARSSSLSAQAPAAPSLLVAADALPAHPSLTALKNWSVALRYVRGYSVQGNWLCYGWATGAYHCTQHWRGTPGHYISLNPPWVPSQMSSGQSNVPTKAATLTASAHVVNTYPFGQCTYGAQALRPDEYLGGLGNAAQWFWNARARGLPTGYTPRVGATVVFQPGVQGASWLGHVGHVVAIGANGAFLMEAMNDANGWGRYAYRWVHTGPGVGFIYG